MLKNIFVYLCILYSILLFARCGEDNAPASSQFIYSNDTTTVVINMPKGGITIFVNGRYVYQRLSGMAVIGEYPEYDFEYGELSLNAVFSSPKTFTATVTSELAGVELPHTMVFKADNKVLDANSDGLLDSWYEP